MLIAAEICVIFKFSVHLIDYTFIVHLLHVRHFFTFFFHKMIQMPNHTSARYQFEHGRQLWSLDKEFTKIKSEICFCKSNKYALDKAEKKEIRRLCEIYHDEKLQHVTKTTKDHRISRKLKDIWSEQEQMCKDLKYYEVQLGVIKEEIDYYMHSTM